MNRWFTSDTHFNHKSVQRFCPDTRLQGDIFEHDQRLIDNWNELVRDGDQVYHLGDFSFGSNSYTKDVLKRLNGDIHLIFGNHDKMLKGGDFSKFFASRQDYKDIRVDGVKIVMFHYPIYEWDAMHYGAYQLFGHVHRSYKTVRGKSMNVGIDARPNGDMCPFSLEEVREYMKDKPILRHH